MPRLAVSDEYIATLYNEPRSGPAVARALGVTETTVRRRLARHRAAGGHVRDAGLPTQRALNRGEWK